MMKLFEPHGGSVIKRAPWLSWCSLMIIPMHAGVLIDAFARSKTLSWAYVAALAVTSIVVAVERTRA